MNKTRAVGLLKMAVPIKAVTQQEFDEFIEAVNMAIKALEPEPCDDAVDRQRLLDDLKIVIATWKEYPLMAELIKGVETAISYVEVMPSVTPKQRTFDLDEAAKRLNGLICDVNPAEICSQIESDNLTHWCEIVQTEMKKAMVQLPCWVERRTDEQT